MESHKDASGTTAQELTASLSDTKTALSKANDVIEAQRVRLAKLEESIQQIASSQNELTETLESSHQVSEKMRLELERYPPLSPLHVFFVR